MATFERDFDRAVREHPDPRVRAALRQGGRNYAAAGWLVFHDAIFAHPRRRKGPGECHATHCPCPNHHHHPQEQPHD